MDINKIPKLFRHYSYEQIQEQIKEGKQYFYRGAENLPIDVSCSIRFLNDLEELLDLFWQSPKEQKILHSRPGRIGHGCMKKTMEDNFQGISYGIKILQTETRMILTRDNMVHYQDFIEFVEILMAVHGD